MSDNPKSSSNMPTIIVVILAMLGLATFPQGSSKTSETPPKSVAEAEVSRSPEEAEEDRNELGPLSTIKADRIQFSPNFNLTLVKPQGLLKETAETKRDEILRSLPGLRFVILLVPDPNDSSMSHEFDLTLSALQRATESAGFVAVRWSGMPGFPPRKKAATAGNETRGTSSYSWPGGVLSRPTGMANDEAQKTRILSLLVPESPTRGVDKDRLSAAVKLVQRHRKVHDPKCKDPKKLEIRIVGPNFSGSMASIAEVLKPLVPKGETQKIIIYNGRASAIERSLTLFRDLPEGSIKFRSTVYSNQVLESAVMSFINDVTPKGKTPRKAMLVESNTGGGQQSQPGKDNEPQFFSFPLNISQIREEYASKGYLRANEPMKLQSPERLSPLEMVGVQGKHDLIPVVSPGPTATGGEMILSQILVALERGRFDWVGIVATNPYDRLFLAEKVRDSCPDVRLFFTMPTTLYTHHTAVPYLRGSIIATTYPLDPETQTWTPSPGWRSGKKVARLAFGNHYEEGIYNAAVAHLADLKLDDNPDFLDYAHPAENSPAGSVPPVWITVVGQRGFHPIRAIRPDRAWTIPPDDKFFEHGGLYRTDQWMELPADFAPGLIDSTWVKLFTTGSFLGIASSLFYLYVWHASRSSGRTCSWRKDGLKQRIEHPSAQRLMAAATSVALSLFLVFSAPAFTFLRLQSVSGNTWRSRLALFFGLTCITTLSLAAAATIAISQLWRQKERIWYCRSIMLVCIVQIGLCLWLLLDIVVFSKTSDRLLDFSRTTRLVNGVTPLVPILLLTLAGGAVLIGDWRRIGLRLRLRAALDRDRPKEGPLAAISDKLEDARVCMAGPNHSWRQARLWTFIPFWAALSLFGMIATGNFPGAIEPQWQYWCLFLLSFGMTLSLLVLRLVDMIGVSMTLDRLLRRLAESPLLKVFDRLPVNLARDDFWRPVSLVRTAEDESDSRIDRQLTSVIVGYLANRTKIVEELHKKSVDLGPLDLLGEAFSRPDRAATVDLWPETDDDGQNSVVAQAGEEPWPIDSLHLSYLKPGRLATRNWWSAVNLFTPLLAPFWASRPAFFHTSEGDKKSADEDSCEWMGVEDVDVKRWLRSVEDLIAMVVVRQLSWLRAAVETILGFLVAGLILMTLVLTSYPFEPQGPMFALLGALTAITVGTIVVVAVQASRDEVLSRLNKTATDRFTFDRQFLTIMITSVAPLLGLLGALSYSLSDLVRSLFEPFFRAG